MSVPTNPIREIAVPRPMPLSLRTNLRHNPPSTIPLPLPQLHQQPLPRGHPISPSHRLLRRHHRDISHDARSQHIPDAVSPPLFAAYTPRCLGVCFADCFPLLAGDFEGLVCDFEDGVGLGVEVSGAWGGWGCGGAEGNEGGEFGEGGNLGEGDGEEGAHAVGVAEGGGRVGLGVVGVRDEGEVG